MSANGTVALRHGRVSLALHELRGGSGPKLLCLHALGATSEAWREPSRAWPGPVFALDFSGHGRSGRVRGGGYTPELLAGDADAALAHLGEAVLARTLRPPGRVVVNHLGVGLADLVFAEALVDGARASGRGTILPR